MLLVALPFRCKLNLKAIMKMVLNHLTITKDGVWYVQLPRKRIPANHKAKKERTMEKIFVLTIEEQDGLYLELYRSRENAVKYVLDDLHDRYHFDTDEPYISESELQEKRNAAVSELDKYGWWKDDEVTYCLDEKLVQD